MKLPSLRAAGWYYTKRYHMTYVHAKKVFVFDILLLCLTVALCGTAIFWFLADPQIEETVELAITQEEHIAEKPHTRLRGGEHVRYTIAYKNTRDSALVDLQLKIYAPKAFLFDESAAGSAPSDHSLFVGTLQPGGEGTSAFSGRLFGEPDREIPLSVQLTYTDETSQERRTQITTILIIPRDSVVEAEIHAPDRLLTKGTAPFTLNIANTYHHDTPPLRIPLSAANGITLAPESVTHGKIEDGVWVIEALPAFGTSTLTGMILTTLPKETPSTLIEITPSVVVNNTSFPQQKTARPAEIVSAEANMSLSWQESSAKGGETPHLNVVIENTGTIGLEQLSLALADETHSVPDRHWGKTALPELLSDILPNEKRTITLPLPLLKEPPFAGIDLVLAPSFTLTAHVIGMPQDMRVRIEKNAPPLPIGTSARITGTLRYFTVDGDQLGRGPLPPTVGKETRYWAILKVKNTTSKITHLTVTARLTDAAFWGEKTSVTHGTGVSFDSAARTVSWNLSSIIPHTEATAAFQIGIIPTVAQVGSHPRLLENIQMKGTDSFVGNLVTLSAPALDTTLPNDPLGKAKGTAVANP